MISEVLNLSFRLRSRSSSLLVAIILSELSWKFYLGVDQSFNNWNESNEKYNFHICGYSLLFSAKMIQMWFHFIENCSFYAIFIHQNWHFWFSILWDMNHETSKCRANQSHYYSDSLVRRSCYTIGVLWFILLWIYWSNNTFSCQRKCLYHKAKIINLRKFSS